MWTIAKNLLGKEDQDVVIKVDPSWGYVRTKLLTFNTAEIYFK